MMNLVNRLFRQMLYGSIGPLAGAAASFLLTLSAAVQFSSHDLGVFNFLLVATGFAQSLSYALFATPLVLTAINQSSEAEAIIAAIVKVGYLIIPAFAGLTGVVSLFLGLPADQTIGYIVMATLILLRSTFRDFSLAHEQQKPVLISDLIFATVLGIELLVVLLSFSLTPLLAIAMLGGANLLAIAGFPIHAILRQLRLALSGRLASYLSVWREHTKWSALGVLFGEGVTNGHAYLVTFLAGPAAYAPIGLAGVLFRPVQITLGSLMVLERPKLGRLALEGLAGSYRLVVSDMRMNGYLNLLGTVIFAIVLVAWSRMAEKYDHFTLFVCIAFFTAIFAARAWRMPISTTLQALGRLRSLALLHGAVMVVSLGLMTAIVLTQPAIYALLAVIVAEIALMIGMASLLKETSTRL